MIHFFGNEENIVYAVQTSGSLTSEDTAKLNWIFGNVPQIEKSVLTGFFIGPRPSMITPWSTNAVEITQNMGISGIVRIEEFEKASPDATFDPMLFHKFPQLDQKIFDVSIQPEPILEIDDIARYNTEQGLAMTDDEIDYLNELAARLGRKLTDTEVFGFSQVNSEHCRHKIFNGTFIIDGETMPESLFSMIRKTSSEHPNEIVSAYKDNVAFINGPKIEQFAPATADKPDFYQIREIDSVLSLKAETHNFPTTVEPFNGAATGSGGEIRDRLAGGQGSLPLAGTAVYMTSYPRLNGGRRWETAYPERKWLYQTPLDILIKASNGASDFGNKFGQPLITGSVLTFEHEEHNRKLAYDKVIMLAGGIGYGRSEQSKKQKPSEGDRVVVLGGENYRIGMGGAAVSSADTGEFGTGIELNAVQRSNPEMQKRAANAIRGLVESERNPIVSIHDHGAGGHLNCLSELVEESGGKIYLNSLPVGDPTLSAREIIGNESQERMGLVIAKNDIDVLRKIAERERAPLYDVGEVTGDGKFLIESRDGARPMDFNLSDIFGSSPKTTLSDSRIERVYEAPQYSADHMQRYLEGVLQLEAVACKDWLTNKVDRCVGGRVAKQQCAGPLQLPLNNVGVMALDFKGVEGIATTIGHAPISAIADAEAGSRNAIAEALTNMVWAPVKNGLSGVSLSANWMWPCKNPGEDARLYDAVRACSEFAIELGINIPTGKDSLSMKQKYPDGEVLSPGTVVISAAANCTDIRRVVEPVLQKDGGNIYYINMSGRAHALGGSSFAQVLNRIGNNVPDIADAAAFKKAFNAMQSLIEKDLIQAGHDVASGGLITTLLEMCFADTSLGAEIDLSGIGEEDSIRLLFSENAGIVFQGNEELEDVLRDEGIPFFKIGKVAESDNLIVKNNSEAYHFEIPHLRDVWFKTSYLLDCKQSGEAKALERYQNYKSQVLSYQFHEKFDGRMPSLPVKRPKAAIIREKGSNSEREMAIAMYLAGFDVKDVHMTDLISGRETLEDIQFIGAVGGFSNSDVLGSAKGWAGAFLYNEKAKTALDNFLRRKDTLSVGICNGCQLFMELEVINPDHEVHGKMKHNQSGKHESGFTSVVIQENNSVMLSSLAGSTLGVWISHGEGRFDLPYDESRYDIVAKYAYDGYPANPNGSHFDIAMICDSTGRHLVTMPHIERSTFPWNWAHYPKDRQDEVSPWLEAFVNARKWIENVNS